MRKTTVSPGDPVPAGLIKPGRPGSKETPHLEVKKPTSKSHFWLWGSYPGECILTSSGLVYQDWGGFPSTQ